MYCVEKQSIQFVVVAVKKQKKADLNKKKEDRKKSVPKSKSKNSNIMQK